ncbi:hypothetical protein ACEWPM_018275 [Roseovarius sp. S4756]|uniref:hypothetical protein n=1 Tax=Roseovarius maritimus TaxID=3342637 RepID=UPI0037277A6D
MRQTVKTAAKVDDGRDVVKIEAEGNDPALTAFLELLANDIELGNRVMELPPAAVRFLRSFDAHNIDVDEAIEGNVDL